MDYGGNRYSGFSTEKDLPILQQRLVLGETARSILHNQSKKMNGDSECTDVVVAGESMNNYLYIDERQSQQSRAVRSQRFGNKNVRALMEFVASWVDKIIRIIGTKPSEMPPAPSMSGKH